MKKEVHPSYLNILISTAVALLVTGVCTVASTTYAGKKKVENDLDETLALRIRKSIEITEYNDFYSVFSGDIYSDENLDSLYYEELNVLGFLSGEPGEIRTDPEYEIGLSYLWTSESYADDEDLPLSMTIITDEYGDQITFMNSMAFFTFNGYSYSAIESLDDNGEMTFEYGGSCNLASQRNPELDQDAETILRSGGRKGWYDDYRYFVLTYNMVEIEEDQPLQLFMDLPYEDDKHDTDIPDDARVISSYKYIYFMDGAEKRDAWRTQTGENISMMLCIWLVLTSVTAVLIRFFLKTRKGVRWGMIDANGCLVETGAQKRPDKETSARVPSGGEISEDLARELLSYIEQSESSMGPNAFLDQMRSLIEAECKNEPK